MNAEKYEEIKIISHSGKSLVVLVKEKATGRLYVRKCAPYKKDIYEKLKNIHCKYLPEIVSIEDSGSSAVVTEEYIDGITLREAIDTAVPFSRKTKLYIITEVCSALSVLHKNGLIHRDIKPSNIMLVNPLSKKPEVKLIDFDAVREPKTGAEKDTSILGTEGYAPPEQYGFSQTDSRADIYSLGVVADEFFSGEKWAKKYKSVINKCCSKDAKRRYKTARRLKLALLIKNKKRFVAALLILIVFHRRLYAVATRLPAFTKDAVIMYQVNSHMRDDYYAEGVQWTGEYAKDNIRVFAVREYVDTLFVMITSTENYDGTEYTNKLFAEELPLYFLTDESVVSYDNGSGYTMQLSISGKENNRKIVISDNYGGDKKNPFGKKITGEYKLVGAPDYDSVMEKKTDRYYEGVLNAYVGAWDDYYGSKCHIGIEKTGDDRLRIKIHWSVGYLDDSVWIMNGSLDRKTEHIYYSDCVNQLVHLSEETGERTYTDLYTGGSGEFYFENGYLFWVDNNENAAAECQFMRGTPYPEYD